MSEYAVVRIGGSLGESPFNIVKSGLTRDEAKLEAKNLRKLLSKGEKTYYRISYQSWPQEKAEKALRSIKVRESVCR